MSVVELLDLLDGSVSTRLTVCGLVAALALAAAALLPDGPTAESDDADHRWSSDSAERD